MPRAARMKNPETTHHIMCRSISEIQLFRNDKDKKTARRKYAQFVTHYNKITQKEDLITMINTLTKSYEYRSERFFLTRDTSPEEVVAAVSELLHISSPHLLKIKYNHQLSDFRAISAFFLRCLCDYTYRDICKTIGNICISEVGKLCQRGFYLVKNDSRYQSILPTLINTIRAA